MRRVACCHPQGNTQGVVGALLAPVSDLDVQGEVAAQGDGRARVGTAAIAAGLAEGQMTDVVVGSADDLPDDVAGTAGAGAAGDLRLREAGSRAAGADGVGYQAGLEDAELARESAHGPLREVRLRVGDGDGNGCIGGKGATKSGDCIGGMIIAAVDG